MMICQNLGIKYTDEILCDTDEIQTALKAIISLVEKTKQPTKEINNEITF